MRRDRADLLNIFGFDAVLHKKDSYDKEMLTPELGKEVTIKVQSFGKSLEIQDDIGRLTVNAQVYYVPEETVVEHNIEVGDFLDNQPIQEMFKYTRPSSRLHKAEKVFYEIYTYNKR